jgi:hypothetical protein
MNTKSFFAFIKTSASFDEIHNSSSSLMFFKAKSMVCAINGLSHKFLHSYLAILLNLLLPVLNRVFSLHFYMLNINLAFSNLHVYPHQPITEKERDNFQFILDQFFH